MPILAPSNAPPIGPPGKNIEPSNPMWLLRAMVPTAPTTADAPIAPFCPFISSLNCLKNSDPPLYCPKISSENSFARSDILLNTASNPVEILVPMLSLG